MITTRNYSTNYSIISLLGLLRSIIVVLSETALSCGACMNAKKKGDRRPPVLMWA